MGNKTDLVARILPARHWRATSRTASSLVRKALCPRYETTPESASCGSTLTMRRGGLTSSKARSISQHMHPLSLSLGVDPFPFPFPFSAVPRNGFPTARPFELLAQICRLCLSLRKYALRSGLWIRDWRMADKKHV